VAAGWLGCLGLAVASAALAGSVVDADGDGVPDPFDNCLQVANGPLAFTASCNGQEDGDLDGYGNICDTDIDNDGATSLVDVAGVLQGVQLPVLGNDWMDFNCDGGIGLDDLSRVFLDASQAALPGPSGLACAGVSTPCVAE